MKIYVKDAAFQKLEVLKHNRNKRARYGEFLIEGVRNINEAVKRGWEITSFVYDDEVKLSQWAAGHLQSVKTQENIALANGLMAELSGKASVSELMAVVSMERAISRDLQEVPLFVLFDRPANKGNLGTMFRSCDALGADRLIITGHSVDVYDPEVIGSSMGSFFKLPFLRLSDRKDIEDYIADLRRRFPQLVIAGTAEASGKAVYDIDLSVPVLLMIGNEKNGLNRHLQELCDVMVEIPMSKDRAASSLNVSCAATVFFYEVMRQRQPRF